MPLYYPLMQIALPPIAARLQRRLEKYAREADLIHNVRIGREALSYAALQAARHQGIPFVLTPVHHPRWVGLALSRVYNELYRNADAVLALTESEKHTLVALGVSEENIFVIGHRPCIGTGGANR